MTDPADHLRTALAVLDDDLAATQRRRDAVAAALSVFDRAPSPDAEDLDDTPEPPPAPTPPAIAAERPKPDRRGGARPKHDYARVAELARLAHSTGQSRSKVVAEALGITAGAAKQAITKADRLGHETYSTGTSSTARQTQPDPSPAPAPAEKAPATRPVARPAGGTVLQCGECDDEFDNAPALMRHTMGVHKRRATMAERTPIITRGT